MRNLIADWVDDRTGYRALFRTFSDEIDPRRRPLAVHLRHGNLLHLPHPGLHRSHDDDRVQPIDGQRLGKRLSTSTTSCGWAGSSAACITSAPQAVIVLLVLHLVQTLFAGAYRQPREFNWWLGLALLILVVGFGHTGYQLPWDQKGYWATKVVTNIMSGAPVIGPFIKTVVVGGTEYGNQTLTRLYGLHVGILPVLMFLCLWAHVSLARKHGLTPPAQFDSSKDERTGRARRSRTWSSSRPCSRPWQSW